MIQPYARCFVLCHHRTLVRSLNAYVTEWLGETGAVSHVKHVHATQGQCEQVSKAVYDPGSIAACRHLAPICTALCRHLFRARTLQYCWGCIVAVCTVQTSFLLLLVLFVLDLHARMLLHFRTAVRCWIVAAPTVTRLPGVLS